VINPSPIMHSLAERIGAAIAGQEEPVRSRLLAAVEAGAPLTVCREADGDLTVVVDGVAVLRVDPLSLAPRPLDPTAN
jgi:hypothetical protein